MNATDGCHAADTETIHHRLAHELGLSIRSSGLVPAKGFSFQQAIAAGIVPLDEEKSGFRIALSPSTALLRAPPRHDLKHRTDVVVMPAAAFRTMLRLHAREEILTLGSDGLGKQHPSKSAKTGMSRGQSVCILMLIALVLFSLATRHQAGLLVIAILTFPIFGALLILRLGAAIDGWTIDPVPAMPIADRKLPVYTILVPLYREVAVLSQLLEALLRLDYPHDRLDIKILVEEDDLEMQTALADRSLPDHIDVVIIPRGTPQTKPRALNIGLIEARGELLAIFDAEDRPEPRQLRLAANLFRRQPQDVACLQARLAIDNADDTILTRLFALEYAALFDVINSGLIRAGAPVLLGGTSNHFRTAILRKIGGWDAWNVTEDADLSFRLLRSGYRISDLPSTTLEEAPKTVGPWLSQRIRWMKGFLQTLITHTQKPSRLWSEVRAKNAMVLISLCGGTVLSALSYPLFLLATVATVLTDGLPLADTVAHAVIIGVWITMFAGGLIALIVPVIVGARHRGLLDLIWLTPLLPVYCLLVSAAAYLAIIEYVRAPWRWNKTEHGLAETSRLKKRSSRDIATESTKQA